MREGDGWDKDREAGEKGKRSEEKTQAGFTGRRFPKHKQTEEKITDVIQRDSEQSDKEPSRKREI